MSNLKTKHIVVGVSGGIAAYKIPELIRLLRKSGAEVKVTMTRNALNFVTELTMRTLSNNDVYSDVFAAINHHATEHISLPNWADLMVVAPASADVLGKMANGIADDALTTTFLATRKPVVIAPAMNDNMYRSEATQQAIQILSSRPNITILDCAEGELACGTVGKGRMQEVQDILYAIEKALTPKTMLGQHVLITAGPTKERLDPVRYLSNDSSGKMGYALARACYNRGAIVTLISGPTALPSPIGCETIRVSSAEQMYQMVMSRQDEQNMIILCAAVADFTPTKQSASKIKKIPNQTLFSLELQTTPDIAAAVGANRREEQTLVGFALETNDAETNALHKLRNKGLDWIVLNSLENKGAGFELDTNMVTLFSNKGDRIDLPLATKEEIAEGIIDNLLRH